MENNWPETIDELLEECQRLISKSDLYTLGERGEPFSGETEPRVDGTEYLAGEYQYGVAMIPAQWVTHVLEVATLGGEVNGETSDGYHTFNELYHHRAVLFSVVVANYRDIAWKARKHHDGTMYDGMFIVGIDTPWGQASYHYDIDPYWDMFDCEERELAPEWDGHTPDEAIARIAELGSDEPPYDELIRVLENDWNIRASWDGLRKFWCIELTEEGVKLRDATHGTLTAEQVRETVEKHWHDLPDEYDMPEATALPEYSYDWQAIADELNAALGGGTCHMSFIDEYETASGDEEYLCECSECGYMRWELAHDLPLFCSKCGKRCVHHG